MPERANRRDQILDTASNFFMNQGYTSTSVRQIAEAVGCTEAALYYHFKDGKRELLRAVFEQHLPHFTSLIDRCGDADSLRDLVIRLGHQLNDHGREWAQRMRWMLVEYPVMDEEERDVFRQKHVQIRHRLTDKVRRFVSDPAEAEQTALLIMTFLFGYGQMFINLDVGQTVKFPPVELFYRLADRLDPEGA
jgi:AcrR family transcriptional regulator